MAMRCFATAVVALEFFVAFSSPFFFIIFFISASVMIYFVVSLFHGFLTFSKPSQKKRVSFCYLCCCGAVGPVTGPREGAVLARSPLYPLLPGALVRLMVTKGARAFAEALLSDG